jgi:hypothetical protein
MFVPLHTVIVRNQKLFLNLSGEQYCPALQMERVKQTSRSCTEETSEEVCVICHWSFDGFYAALLTGQKKQDKRQLVLIQVGQESTLTLQAAN